MISHKQTNSTAQICRQSHSLSITQYTFLLHIMCGYQCDKAVNKNDTREVIWYHFTDWNDVISLHGFELSNQIDCNNLVVKEVLYEVRCLNQLKTWSSHLLDNLSNCLLNLKNSGDSTGFEPMTSAMPVQCSDQLSYEVTQWRAGQYVGLMFSRERNVVWKKCYML